MFSGGAPGRSQWSTGTMMEPVAPAPKVSVPSHAMRAVQASGTRMRRARIAKALHDADALTIRAASIRECTNPHRFDVRCARCAFPTEGPNREPDASRADPARLLLHRHRDPLPGHQ